MTMEQEEGRDFEDSQLYQQMSEGILSNSTTALINAPDMPRNMTQA